MTKLTDRQYEILMLISEEYTTLEIATKLGLSSGTIEIHRRALFNKFDARNVAGLIRKACSQGFFKGASKMK